MVGKLKLPIATFRSIIKIRNYVAFVVLGDEYFVPLIEHFDGYYGRGLSSNCNQSPCFNRLHDVDEAFTRFYIRERGLLADFIDPANVPWLPKSFILEAINSVSSFELVTVSPLTFLAYANLTSMLGIRFLYNLDGDTQCLTCHQVSEECACIVHSFEHIQRLKCRCGLQSQRMCHCNGVPAMIRDLDEFSIILDSIIFNIFGINSQGGNAQMRSRSKSYVLTRRMKWRQATRKRLVVSGKIHVAAWDFRPP